MTDLTQAIATAYSEHQDFLLIALTGRTGSGCTTAADLLSRSFSEIPFNVDSAEEPEKRKLKILGRFAESRWIPFKQISVSAVITSFLLEKSWEDVQPFLAGLQISETVQDQIRAIWSEFHARGEIQDFFATLRKQQESYIEAVSTYEQLVAPASSQLRSILSTAYHSVFQTIGNNLRISGNPLSSDVQPSLVFALSRRITALIKCYRKADRISNVPTRIVLDAIRNPLELVFLRDRFTPFYVIAITADDEERKGRLRGLGYDDAQISVLDEREYSSKRKLLDDYDTFVSQNIQNCIQKADIFIHNAGGSGGSATHQTKDLGLKLVRYAVLATHPGLVTPTRDERCMQIAFVAKLNSGCISRQVGAVVADQNHSIKSVGWNDVAKGQVPCLLRDVGSLARGDDDEAFSQYELNDDKFRNKVVADFSGRDQLSSAGLPCPYCFKDAYNKRDGGNDKNQVHTRALHAEENAFLQLAKFGNSGIERGFLYTTASPCELCSKKAYQLGIQEVVYIDPYPGISTSHVLSVGPEKLRPKLRLFSGAVGNAYHQLYSSVLPIKDEIDARRRVELATHPAGTTPKSLGTTSP